MEGLARMRKWFKIDESITQSRFYLGRAGGRVAVVVAARGNAWGSNTIGRVGI